MNNIQIQDTNEGQRPWGHYTVLGGGKGYQLKELVVKPGARLSLQSHKQRSEHWLVIEGTAKATVGETDHTLLKGQSIDIAVGEKHRLANPGDTTLRIIEIQTGTYFGEDDIERYADDYSRT